MTKKPTEKSELTPTQVEDAGRLRALWQRRKDAAKDAKERFTQDLFAADNGFTAGTMVWQYLSAHRPLNIQAAAAFARGLKVDVADFSPTLAGEINQVAATTAPKIESQPETVRRHYQWLTEAEASLLTNYRTATDEGRRQLDSLGNRVEKAIKPPASGTMDE